MTIEIMKKIKIKINSYEIEVLVELLSIVGNNIVIDRDFKVVRSVLLPVYKRLANRTVNLGLKNKKMNFSMAFHEAHYLEMFLQDFKYWSNEYINNVTLQIKNEINQQLA